MSWVQVSPTQYRNTVTAMYLVLQNGQWLLQKFDEPSYTSRELISLNDLFNNPITPIATANSENFVIYKPGAPSIAPVYGTWVEAYAAFQNLPDGSTIYVENYNGGGPQPTVPAGTYDMRAGTIAKISTTINCGLNCDDGANIQNLGALRGIYLGSQNTTGPLLTWTPPFSGGPITLLLYSASAVINGGTVPALQVPVTGGAPFLLILDTLGCYVIKMTAAAVIDNPTPGQICLLGVLGTSKVDPGSCQGAGDFVFQYGTLSSQNTVASPTNMPGITGSLTRVFDYGIKPWQYALVPAQAGQCIFHFVSTPGALSLADMAARGWAQCDGTTAASQLVTPGYWLAGDLAISGVTPDMMSMSRFIESDPGGLSGTTQDDYFTNVPGGGPGTIKANTISAVPLIYCLK